MNVTYTHFCTGGAILGLIKFSRMKSQVLAFDQYESHHLLIRQQSIHIVSRKLYQTCLDVSNLLLQRLLLVAPSLIRSSTGGCCRGVLRFCSLVRQTELFLRPMSSL